MSSPKKFTAKGEHSGTMNDASLWSSSEFADPDFYRLTLDDVMRQELVERTRSAVVEGLDFDRLTPTNFQLPNLTRVLDYARTSLEDGCGFCVIRGVPIEVLDHEGRVMLLAGISAHLGELVCQSVHRNKMEEIVDRKQPLDHTSRGYNDTRGIPFHTDGADYAGLLCLATACEGGESLLASGAAAHETIRAERPDLLAVLKEGLFHHRRGEQPPGEAPVLPGISRRKTLERHRRPWYLVEIMIHIHLLNAAIEADDTEQAALNAYQIADRIGLAERLRHSESGYKTAKLTNIEATEKRKRAKDLWYKYRQQNATTTNAEIFCRVRREMVVSASTLYRWGFSKTRKPRT